MADHAATEAEAHAALAQLTLRTAAIEDQLARISAGVSSHGRGAYSGGGGIVVEGQGSTTLLEDLANLRKALAEMEATDRSRIQRVRELGGQLTAARSELETLRGDLRILRTAAPDAEVALNELAETEARLFALQEAHRASEAGRLTIEQQFFALSAEVLRLRPLETQALLDLQRRMRDDLEDLEPTDLNIQSDLP